MAKLYFIFTCLLFFTFPLLGHAANENAAPLTAELFSQGTKAYLSKDYAKASSLFGETLAKDPANAVVLTNLALAEFNLGRKSYAIGLLRKALAFSPDLQTAKESLEYVVSQVSIKEMPHKNDLYESLRVNFLQPVHLSSYLLLTAISLFSSGWLLISYGGRRKKASEEEGVMPSFPVIGSIISVMFLIFLGFSMLKTYDQSIVRGTVIEDQTAMQTAPGDNQVSIVDLYGGMEVVVKQIKEDWVQVTYPGSHTGWIKKSSLLMTR